MSPLSRRDFLLTTGAAAGASMLPTRSLLHVGAHHAARDSWVPSDAMVARLPELLRLAVVPAVSIAVFEEGAISFARAFGVRNANSAEPVDEHTVFEAASLSKPPVAFVALMLRDAGVFDIDRPLVEYVAPAHLLDDPRARDITARHVMTQSSGLRNWRRPTDKEFPLSFAPGARYQYSGEGFVWLARALEEATGTGFVRLMRERLFVPLGLPTSTYLWHAALDDRMATGHNQRGEPTREGMHGTMARAHRSIAQRTGRSADEWRWDDLVAAVREERPDSPLMPGGIIPNAAASLLTTASEYARFVGAMLDAPGVPLLDDTSRQLMSTPFTPVEAPLSWGMGTAVEEHDGRRYVWHWGNNGDFHAFAIGDVTGRRALAVLTNATNGPRVYQRVVQDALGFDPAALAWI